MFMAKPKITAENAKDICNVWNLQPH